MINMDAYYAKDEMLTIVCFYRANFLFYSNHQFQIIKIDINSDKGK